MKIDDIEVTVGGQVCKPYTVTDAEEQLSLFGLTGYEHATGKLTLEKHHMGDYPTLLVAEDGMVADTMRMVFTQGNNRKAGASRAQKNLANAIRLAACWNAFDGVPIIEIGRVIGELRSQIIGERTNHAAELEQADAHYDAKHDAMADTLAELSAAQAQNSVLLEFYKASRQFESTCGHEDATVEDEGAAELRYNNALIAVETALTAAGAA